MAFYLSTNDLAGAVASAVTRDLRINGSVIGGVPQVRAVSLATGLYEVIVSWHESGQQEVAFELTEAAAVQYTKRFLDEKPVHGELFEIVQSAMQELEARYNERMRAV